MIDGLPVAKSGDKVLALLPGLANRHGLVTGATGTGKTVTLQTIAEQLSRIGVPVFMADVKGDLAGIAAAGGTNAKVTARAQAARRAVELRRLPGRLLGRVRQERASAPRDRLASRPAPVLEGCSS